MADFLGGSVVASWADPVMGFHVTVTRGGGAAVVTRDGRKLWWESGSETETPRVAVEAQLQRFSTVVRQPALRALELPAMPGRIHAITADASRRWAARGGEGSEGWLVASMIPAPVRLASGRRSAVHFLGADIVLVDGYEPSVVTRIDGDGAIQQIASIPAYHNGSCATDNLILLTFGYENGSPWRAVDREGQLVFDFDRDLTRIYDDGSATMVLAGGYPDTGDVLSHVEGDRVAWKDMYTKGEAQILDLATRTATYLTLPPMFDDVPMSVAPDGTVTARVIPDELWTVRGDGPIDRSAIPDLPRTDPIGGGRLLLWDPETAAALVVDPTTSGG